MRNDMNFKNHVTPDPSKKQSNSPLLTLMTGLFLLSLGFLVALFVSLGMGFLLGLVGGMVTLLGFITFVVSGVDTEPKDPRS